MTELVLLAVLGFGSVATICGTFLTYRALAGTYSERDKRARERNKLGVRKRRLKHLNYSIRNAVVAVLEMLENDEHLDDVQQILRNVDHVLDVLDRKEVVEIAQRILEREAEEQEGKQREKDALLHASMGDYHNARLLLEPPKKRRCVLCGIKVKKTEVACAYCRATAALGPDVANLDMLLDFIEREKVRGKRGYEMDEVSMP